MKKMLHFINKKVISSISAVIFGLILLLSIQKNILAEKKETFADPNANTMPVTWNDAFHKIIKSPDIAAIEKGEILYQLDRQGDDTAAAQTMSIINATPERCYQIVKDYNNYQKVMPFTAEAKITRTFKLEGNQMPGLETVDFYSRVSVLGFDTKYLLRIAHIPEPELNKYRTFWTLVNTPEKANYCRTAKNKPCENDLAENLGAHLFEAYKGNPNKTLYTYTLLLKGKSWVQRTALNLSGGSTMKDVSTKIRNAAEKK